uniref:Uncharacterized protein n=1 Tax=Rhizophora mucronata TaxID=61149 RepID=A0A2P2QKH5_RHIMU
MWIMSTNSIVYFTFSKPASKNGMQK